MLPHELQNVVPESTPAAEIFQQKQIVREFYAEIKYREELERHCQWYYATAKQHQQEFQKMQGDFNIFGWFCRRRSQN
ncbi:hypothetical protein IQ269_15525 [Tychonema sp. LEGE 07199]|uniref:hypothetical protein n=1 Tax=Microcoleaceae TaxID=1892252 RepID=UPI001880D5B3|nr:MULTISPECIES: hypothetical protein [unclassified Tychonema]MBE9122174.1 hypothetical protein [Tychonema sp. LEGE 07199]MBE9133770.1 hypothetical protein [Tychonema sp. LEGE 07196]MBE9165597.1 hypothetical protein [Tychonema sp. LEGE 06208]